MKSLKKILTISLALGVIFGAAVNTSAAELDKQNFKVVGSWGGLNPYKNFEANFWNVDLPIASGGRITGQISPVTSIGLKGFEVMRLLKLGVFDAAFGAIGYIAGDNPAIEGAALSSLSQDVDTTWAITKAYREIVAQEFEKSFNAKLLMMYGYSSNMFFCGEPVNSLADIKGKKIRTYSTTLSDFVEGAGGSGVTVAFAEMVPALEKGVVDCVITALGSAYDAKLSQVAKNIYGLRVGWGMSFGAMNLDTWNKLSPETQAFLEAQYLDLEKRMWAGTKEDDANGVACNTDGPCPLGEPGGMKIVLPSEADLKLRDDLLRSAVLTKWIERCGDDCAAPWNDTIGKLIGIHIKN